MRINEETFLLHYTCKTWMHFSLPEGPSSSSEVSFPPLGLAILLLSSFSSFSSLTSDLMLGVLRLEPSLPSFSPKSPLLPPKTLFTSDLMAVESLLFWFDLSGPSAQKSKDKQCLKTFQSSVDCLKLKQKYKLGLAMKTIL